MNSHVGDNVERVDSALALAELLRVLDLELIDGSPAESRAVTFRGAHPRESWFSPGHTRTYGGQLVAQALVAAARTVSADRPCSSLRSTFLAATHTVGSYGLWWSGCATAHSARAASSFGKARLERRRCSTDEATEAPIGSATASDAHGKGRARARRLVARRREGARHSLARGATLARRCWLKVPARFAWFNRSDGFRSGRGSRGRGATTRRGWALRSGGCASGAAGASWRRSLGEHSALGAITIGWRGRHGLVRRAAPRRCGAPRHRRVRARPAPPVRSRAPAARRGTGARGVPRRRVPRAVPRAASAPACAAPASQPSRAPEPPPRGARRRSGRCASRSAAPRTSPPPP
mmetsp:Transcript_1818/g.6660  ORF Transcript_1818/g.6660 Transcript_1818/m.6660 type:complete len:351 (-) Transcript_1818:310-1362(-)